MFYIKKKAKNSDSEEKNEDDERSKSKDSKSNEFQNVQTEDLQKLDDIDKIDLKSEIRLAKERIKDEKLLLVKTFSWEDNIIIDVNNHRTSAPNAASVIQSNISDMIINERVKNAGWVASVEHRTMFSFQSKVLGTLMSYRYCFVKKFFLT